MKNYGNALRSIRESKNMSLESLSDSTVSKSSLSKFERGQIDLTFKKLIGVLNRLNVSFSEFDLIANNYNLDPNTWLHNSVKSAYESESLITLNALAFHEKENWEKTKNIQHKLNFIMTQALIHDIDKTEVNHEDLDFISNYLFDCEIWGRYELVLYGNTMSALSYEMMLSLSKELIRKASFYKKVTSNYETILNIITNTIIIALEKNDKKPSLFFLNFLNNENIPENFFLERTIIMFVKGLAHIKYGDYNQGMDLCEKSIDIMKNIGSVSYYLKFNDYFQKNIVQVSN